MNKFSVTTAKNNIAYSKSKSDESLATILAQFHADRTLTRSPIDFPKQPVRS